MVTLGLEGTESKFWSHELTVWPEVEFGAKDFRSRFIVAKYKDDKYIFRVIFKVKSVLGRYV